METSLWGPLSWPVSHHPRRAGRLPWGPGLCWGSWGMETLLKAKEPLLEMPCWPRPQGTAFICF